ncbi:MAG TPA: hypothetical protein VF029_04590 [Actinomycetota bacterium]
MGRYLVVANQTLAGEALASKIRELARREPSSFHVVVPATPPQDHAWTEGEARATAQRRLSVALSRFRDLGLEAAGEVGDASPMLAIEDALREHGPFDAVVLSTLPPGISRWLKLDLPHRIGSVFGLPVHHVIGEPERLGSRS